MKKPLHPVTDHAVIRYLERVDGVDVDAIRARIGQTVDKAVELGASSAVSGGFRYVIGENGAVVTVLQVHAPARHIGSCKRKREIE